MPGHSDFPTQSELRSLTGHEVVDEHHHKVGTVSDVIYDDDGEARWAVVDPGPLRSEKYVPVEGSYMTEDGEVVIPYTKDVVKSAAKARRDHIVDPVTAHELEEHYELHPTGR